MKNPVTLAKSFIVSRSRKQWLIIGGGVLIALIIIRNLGGGSDGQQAAPIAVQTEEVSVQLVEQAVTSAGKIQPVFETEISSTVSAQIIGLLVQEGEEVAPGDTLIILDRLRSEAAFERSRSGLRSAAARLRQVTAERDRGVQLFEKNLISLQDMEALDASYETAISSHEQAQATLEQVRDDLDKTVLRAPEGGVVTKINKEVGEMALGSTFQADVLLVISDLSSMEVIVEVDETDVVDIEILDMVSIEVDALPKVKFSGRVSRVAHTATITGAGSQEQATNFEVVVTLDINPDSKRIDPRLRPGMSATATIITARSEDLVAVPIQALTARQPLPPKPPEGAADGEGNPAMQSNGEARKERRRGGGREGGSFQRTGNFSGRPGGMGGKRAEPVEVVFVVVKDTTEAKKGFLSDLFRKEKLERVEQRRVELGISSDTHYQILAGLEPGEEIIIGNYRAVSKELKDGSLITRKAPRDDAGMRRRP